MDIAGQAVNLINSKRPFSIRLKSGKTIPCKLMAGTDFSIPEKESDLIKFINAANEKDSVQIGRVAEILETNS